MKRLQYAAPVLIASVLLTIPSGAPARSDLEPPVNQGRSPGGLYAIGEPHLFRHDAGLLLLQITNLGFSGNPFIEEISARWRGAEHLFVSSLWIGALGGDNQPHVSTAAPMELRPDLDARWTIYRSFEGMKNGARLGTPGPAAADDDDDGLVDEDFQDGFDNDGDGRIDEDFAAAGQQMFSCVYRDDTPEAVAQVPGHVPLGVLVRQRSLQWAPDAISEMVGFDYEIVNIGDQVLRQILLGFYVDSDVGPTGGDYWTDDLAGWDVIDTTITPPGRVGPCSMVDHRVETVFMWDAPDGGGVSGGDSPGVYGTVVLGYPTDPSGIRAPQTVELRAVSWFPSAGTEPTDDAERYDLMWNAGKPSGNPRPGAAASSTAIPDDYRYYLSVGSFDRLEPGESMSFRVVQVVGEGFTGFRRNAVNAAQVFRGAYVDADLDPETGIDGKERCLRALNPGDPIFWDDACDTLSDVIRWDDPDSCLWVDADCDPCTGVNGRETRIEWVGGVAPPSPATNLDPALDPDRDPDLVHVVRPAGDGKVTLQWDNGSETWSDPGSGLDAFTGYRIWKATGWTGMLFGPAPESWVRIGEFRNDVPVSDPAHISGVVDPGVDPVGTTGDGKPIYPIGRYEFVDTDVLNDEKYYYAVTAFSTLLTTEGTLELAGRPASPVSHSVVPCAACPVPVRLLGFTAERVEAGARLRWFVGEVEDHAGFHVHRRESGGARIRLTETLLAGRIEYEYTDAEAPSGEVEYWLQELSRGGESAWHGPVVVPEFSPPARFAAGAPGPNPFSSRTGITYSLPDARPVRVSVFDLSGRRIRVLRECRQGPGEFRVTWHGDSDGGRRVAPGLYFVRLEAGRDIASRKVLFTR